MGGASEVSKGDNAVKCDEEDKDSAENNHSYGRPENPSARLLIPPVFVYGERQQDNHGYDKVSNHRVTQKCKRVLHAVL